MYEINTILRLKVQRDPDPETKEEWAYNRVKVLGESPMQHQRGDWTGGDARGVIITPIANFGGVLDEPFGKLRELYDVESIPEVVIEQPAGVRVINATSAAAGPTPEEVFAAEAPGVAPEPGQIRGRLPRPLGEPGGPADSDGPLGAPPSRSRRKA